MHPQCMQYRSAKCAIFGKSTQPRLSFLACQHSCCLSFLACLHSSRLLFLACQHSSRLSFLACQHSSRLLFLACQHSSRLSFLACQHSSRLSFLACQHSSRVSFLACQHSSRLSFMACQHAAICHLWHINTALVSRIPFFHRYKPAFHDLTSRSIFGACCVSLALGRFVLTCSWKYLNTLVRISLFIRNY